VCSLLVLSKRVEKMGSSLGPWRKNEMVKNKSESFMGLIVLLWLCGRLSHSGRIIAE
jgi:hypothetical protein